MDVSSIDMTSMFDQFKGFDISAYTDQISDGVMSMADKDGDGMIGTGEAGFAEQFLSQIDSSGDGALSKEEVSGGILGLKDSMVSFFEMFQNMNQSPDPETLKTLMGSTNSESFTFPSFG